MNIYEKLTNVQAELVAPKNQYNSFGKYPYRSCEDILTAVKPLLRKYGLSLTLTDSVELVAERFYIKAIAAVYDYDGNKIENSAFAREDESKKGMDGSQLTGATSSYARKYALNGLFAIDDNKDPDTNEYHSQVGKTDKAKPVVKCPNCGNEVKAIKKNGKVIEPSEILTKCGGVCTTCYKQAKQNDFEEVK